MFLLILTKLKVEKIFILIVVWEVSMAIQNVGEQECLVSLSNIILYIYKL